MKKIKFDYPKISKQIIYPIVDVVSLLNSAKETSRVLNVPSDFTYSKYLSNLSEVLEESINNLNNIVNWLEKSDVQLSKDLTDIAFDIKGIEEISIEKNNSYIRQN